MSSIYVKSYKTVIKENKDLNKWREYPCSRNERFNIVKISVIPNLIYRFSAISVKKPLSYFIHIDKPALKSI